MLYIFLFQGVVRDNKKAGVFEPAMSKVKSLKFATEVIFSSLQLYEVKDYGGGL